MSSIGGAAFREVQWSDVQNVGKDMTINVGVGPAGALVRGALTKNAFGIKPSAYAIAAMLPNMNGMGNYMVNAVGSMTLNAGKSWSLSVEGKGHASFGKDYSQTVAGSSFISVQKDANEVIGGRLMVDAHEALHLRCGKSELIMMPDGSITMRGTTLDVEQEDRTTLTTKKTELKGTTLDIEQEDRTTVKAGKIELN